MSLRDEKTRITNEKITPPSLNLSIVRMRSAISLSCFHAEPIIAEEARTDR